MSERAHTKGPWSVKHTDTTYYVESAEGLRVVSTSWHGHIRNPYPLKAEAFANATMAAAAPDMFEALTGLLDRYLSLANSGDAGFWDPEEEAEVIAARAALAKASPAPTKGEASDV